MKVQNFIIASIWFMVQLIAQVKASTYQSIYAKCQNNKAACVILTFTNGYNAAWQAAGKDQDRIECALDGNFAQICSYRNGGSAGINCNHSDGISVSIANNKVYPNFKGNAPQTFSSSGEKTSLFTATCLTKG